MEFPIQKIEDCRNKISPYIYWTPLVFSELLTRRFQRRVWLKLEFQQPTGSFKVRPAFYGILNQMEQAKKGVVCSSSGNFAQAVAYAAQQFGIPAHVVMIQSTAPLKQRRTERLGARLHLCENTYKAREELASRLATELGALRLHPFNSVETLYGDATLGLEILKDAPSPRFTAIIPSSGGGLLAGVATLLKNANPHCRVIGAQPQQNHALVDSFQQKRSVNVGTVQTIADALVAPEPGSLALELILKTVDQVVGVTETEIKEALRFLVEDLKLLVEPASAVSLAVLLTQTTIPTEDVIVVLTGANVTLENLISLGLDPLSKKN